MKAIQFPFYFKTVGVIMLVLAVATIFLDRTGVLLNYYSGGHQGSNSLKASYVLPSNYVRTSFYIYQFVAVLIVAALIIIVLSKQKVEDEWIKQKRLVSYKAAFLCIPVLTILFLKYDYELIAALNLVLLWIIQYVVFVYLIKVQPYLFQKVDENKSA
jgi:uncharacterized membrane protein